MNHTGNNFVMSKIFFNLILLSYFDVLMYISLTFLSERLSWHLSTLTVLQWLYIITIMDFIVRSICGYMNPCRVISTSQAWHITFCVSHEVNITGHMGQYNLQCIIFNNLMNCEIDDLITPCASWAGPICK